MKLYVGTSGFSYKEWKGSFYPVDLSAGDMLQYYAERLSSVEINNTFYRLPKAEVLERWSGQVPEDFRFSIKASRRITHFTRLKPEAKEPTEYLLSTLQVLGDRLGVVLFQLPPNLKKDHARLADFLALLPPDTPAAFEFRHESWSDDDVYDLLGSRGFAWVHADTEDDPDDTPIVGTAPWGYLRLRRPGYEADDLHRWAQRVGEMSWERAFVFFKHEDEGAGPRMASEFRTIFQGSEG